MPTIEQIQIRAATTDEDWRQVDRLLSELKEWDLTESQALGLGRDEVLNAFYPRDLETIRRDSVLPDGSMLLAMDAGSPAGCAAFHRTAPQTCELCHVYVRPTHRGRGVASMLLRQLMNDARVAGYETVSLETATFMQSAQKLYKSFGFELRSAYRERATKLDEITIPMEATLRG